VLPVLLSAGRRRAAWTLFGLLVSALPVLLPASKCGVCCLSLVGPRVRWRVGGMGDMPVEALFPEDGRECLKLASSSDWSWILGIDAVGGPPYCDFTVRKVGGTPHGGDVLLVLGVPERR
jgi:hypothetical protein